MSSDFHREISSRNLGRINGFGYREGIAVMEARAREQQAKAVVYNVGPGSLPRIMLSQYNGSAGIRSFAAAPAGKLSGVVTSLGGQPGSSPSA